MLARVLSRWTRPLPKQPKYIVRDGRYQLNPKWECPPWRAEHSFENVPGNLCSIVETWWKKKGHKIVK